MSTSGFCLDKEYWRTYEQKVHSLLEQGLGDRAKSIRVVWRNTNQDSYVESVRFFFSDLRILLFIAAKIVMLF